MPNLTKGRVELTVIFSICTLGMVITTLISSCVDPSDHVMIMYKNDRDRYPSSHPDSNSGRTNMRESCSTAISVRVTLNKNQGTVDLVTGRSFFIKMRAIFRSSLYVDKQLCWRGELSVFFCYDTFHLCPAYCLSGSCGGANCLRKIWLVFGWFYILMDQWCSEQCFCIFVAQFDWAAYLPHVQGNVDLWVYSRAEGARKEEGGGGEQRKSVGVDQADQCAPWGSCGAGIGGG